jgi:hypothetical protein
MGASVGAPSALQPDGEAIFVTFDESLDGAATDEEELLALDVA